MAIRESTIKALAKANDIERRLLEGSTRRCFLLNRSTETKRFRIIQELISGWKTEYSEFRGQMGIFVATLDANFAEVISQSSFAAYGEPRGSLSNTLDVYRIDTERRDLDVLPPTTASPFWKVFTIYTPKELFTIP